MLLSDFVSAQLSETAGVRIDEWNGQNSMLLEIAGKTVWVDPFNVPANTKRKVDIVVITHEHSDHLDKRSLDIVCDLAKTVLYTPASVVDAVSKEFSGKIIPFNIGSSLNIGDVSMLAVPAYNTSEEKKDIHPKEKGWIGLLFTKGRESLYITSDLDRIPELKKIQAKVILLPLGQTYTFNSVEEAAQAVKDVGAEIAIPVHFGMFEGKDEDVKIFEGLMKNMGVKMLLLKKKGEK